MLFMENNLSPCLNKKPSKTSDIKPKTLIRKMSRVSYIHYSPELDLVAKHNLHKSLILS